MEHSLVLLCCFLAFLQQVLNHIGGLSDLNFLMSNLLGCVSVYTVFNALKLGNKSW